MDQVGRGFPVCREVQQGSCRPQTASSRRKHVPVQATQSGLLATKASLGSFFPLSGWDGVVLASLRW